MRKYLITTLNSMATGLFASLLIGTILEQLGLLINLNILVEFGTIAKLLMGPAIGVAVAFGLQAPPLVIVGGAIAGALGANTFVISNSLVSVQIGEPVGAFIAALVGVEFGRRLAGKTPVDILVLPAATIIAGGITGFFISPIIAQFMTGLGAVINQATELHPFPMGIIVSVSMGMILTLPISSAAIAISLGLSGLAAGAATVGCCTQMIGFAVISYKDNKVGGVLAQGLGTSMLQIPNIIRNPWIWIPPTLASAILGPIGTIVFKMQNNPVGAGMGTAGFVGQIGTLATMGSSAWPGIITLHFLLPAILSLIFAQALYKLKWIKTGDMKLKI